MRVANHLSDKTIADAVIGERISFPDGSIVEVDFKSVDKVGKITLTQIRLRNVKKDGTIGKISTWVKIRK